MSEMSVTYSREVLSDGYFLGVEINPYPDTYPTGELEESLVVNTSDEDMARFSTLFDLEDLTVGPDLRWFQADLYTGIPVVGDTLRFTVLPSPWTELGYTAPLDFVITTVTGSLYALEVNAAVPFPCGFTGLATFTVLQGSGPTVRIASTDDVRFTIRRYDQNSSGNPLYVRVAQAAELFTTVIEATNKYESLRAEAASLITDYDAEETSFTGTITEVYE